ncbi:MAG: hypothetical protein WAT51_14025 [Holophaga sp.]
MRTRSLSLVLSALVLSLAIACGGGSSSTPSGSTPSAPPATGLIYTNPTGTGWRLVKDASSTATRVILNLVGPSDLKTRGVGFNLQAPGTIKFGAFTNGMAINEGGVYQLLSAGSADPSEPVALIGGVKAGNLLTAGIFQKDRSQPAQDSGTTLCQIAVLFDATKGLHAGDKLPLQIIKAKVIPEDIGTITDDLLTLDKKMKMADITIAVGSLTAN